MNRKSCIIVALLFCLTVITTIPGLAQKGHHPKFRSNLYSRAYFRRAPKLSFVGGVGLTVVNSDNRVQGYVSNLNLMKGNGYGPNLVLGMGYQLTPYVGVQGNMEFVHLNAYEDIVDFQGRPSYTYRANIVSTSGSVVVNLLNLYNRSRSMAIRRRPLIIPYVKAGIGFMVFNSTAFNNRIEVKPETDYPNVAAVIPLGGGLKYIHSRELTIAPELNINFNSTDYIDSQQSNHGKTGPNDVFVSATVKVIYSLKIQRRKW